MKIVEVAADVVPEPGPTAVQDNAVLLAVVVVGLVLAPVRLLDDLTCEQ